MSVRIVATLSVVVIFTVIAVTLTMLFLLAFDSKDNFPPDTTTTTILLR